MASQQKRETDYYRILDLLQDTSKLTDSEALRLVGSGLLSIHNALDIEAKNNQARVSAAHRQAVLLYEAASQHTELTASVKGALAQGMVLHGIELLK